MTPGGRFLLVEDDESDVLFLKRALAAAGLDSRFDVAGSGRAAMDYLSGRPPFDDRAKHPLPTHVVLDLKLPEKGGLEVLRWIRSEPALTGLRVAVLTSSKQPSDVGQAKALGTDLYLVKPMGFIALLPVVRALDAWIRTGNVAASAF
jgi:DNA-binding response OmpR family regulator